jgi:hypothetical protein
VTSNLVDGLAQLAGVNLLDVNPDQVAADAAAVNGIAPDVAAAATQADATVRRATEDYQGASATALAESWESAGGGRMLQTAAAMNVLPPVVNGFATVASAAKLAEITQLVQLASVLKVAVGAGALGAGVAAARVATTRVAIQRIKHTFERGVAARLTPAVERITRRLEDLGERMPGPRGGLGNLAPAGPGGRISPYAARPLEAASPGDRGMRTFMGWGRKDNTGKFHGNVPDSTMNMTDKEKKQLKKDLEDSIKARQEEEAWLGFSDKGHQERMRREQEALDKINDDLEPW